MELSSETPEVFQYLPYGPFESPEAYDQWYSNRIRPTKESIIFAIILKAGIVRKRKPGSDQFEELKVEDGTFAGTTGLIRADPANSVVEVGNVGFLSLRAMEIILIPIGRDSSTVPSDICGNSSSHTASNPYVGSSA